jgi:hypothetical protein
MEVETVGEEKEDAPTSQETPNGYEQLRTKRAGGGS